MNTSVTITKNTIIAGCALFFSLPIFSSEAFADRAPSNCQTFTFDATESHLSHEQNISYFWDFGDGHTSIEPIVTHTYDHSGEYTVHLSLADNSGSDHPTITASQTVLANVPPTASFTSEERSCINKPLTFDATMSYADNQKDLRYLWNFGDGTITHGEQKVVKSFRAGGDYNVTLTVDDLSKSACSTSTVKKTVHINAPPVADAGDDVILRCVSEPGDMTIHFNASASTDANNDPLGYLWNFGDGNEARGREVAHRYKDIGHYDVRLIVSDNTRLHCGTSVDFVTVKLNQAPQAHAGDDIVTCPGQEVHFDGSKSLIQKKGTMDARWFFGDGNNRQGLKITHRYDKPGIYQATLTLANMLNDMCPVSRDTRMVTVNSQPIVNIKAKSSACVDHEVFLDASSAADADGDALDYYWQFGDGSTSRQGSKVTHRYAQGGTYRVTVIVDDRKGTSCSSATAKTNIRINTPPIADAGLNTTCCRNQPAPFSAQASSDPDGDPLLYIWDFGDGSIAYGEQATYAYTHIGSYNVVLTVDDQSGSMCSKSTDGFTAVVKDSPLPIINIR